MVKYEDKRIMIYVDGSNLHWSTQRYRQKNRIKSYKVDVFKLKNILNNNRDFIRIHWYASTKVPPIEQQTRFYDRLERSGVIVTKKKLKRNKEKGVDVALVTDLLCHGFTDCYDTAIVVSGDEDFCSAYREIRRIGKIIEVAAFYGNFNENVIKNCDKLIILDEIANKIQLK